jgi:uncharacterized damage-inducible protein DinB
MKFCLLAVLLLGAVVPGVAQDVKGFRADLLGQIEYAQKEITDLENAIPENKMTWRPNKEVRSISEVYLHIAFGNYLFAKFAGIPLPADMASFSPSDEAKYDKTTTDKKEIADRLTKSFDFLKESVKKMPDADLEKQVTFFGQEMSVRGMLMSALSHMHEHLGQSIAYARMNNIVPPWTAARQEAEKKEKKSGM